MGLHKPTFIVRLSGRDWDFPLAGKRSIKGRMVLHTVIGISLSIITISIALYISEPADERRKPVRRPVRPAFTSAAGMDQLFPGPLLEILLAALGAQPVG